MARLRPRRVFLLLLLCALALPLFAAKKKRPAHKDPPKPVPPVVIRHADFHGMAAISLRNKASEIIVVPEIGRVMQFSPVDAEDTVKRGPLWSNPAFGKDLHPDVEGWTNYGGDKAWPSPQVDWASVTGKGWPPPKTFDATAYRVVSGGNKVRLTSPIDRAYGIRVRRIISLDDNKPVMTIETIFEKVQGKTVRAGIWTITQLASPEGAYVLLPEQSVLADGYTKLMASPKDIQKDGRILSLVRDLEAKTMIGSDGSSLLWVGDGADLLIEDQTQQAAGERPDQNSHSKVYTNDGDVLKYVEFELLDTLHDMKLGDTVSMKVSYTLVPRTETDPLQEARKVFGIAPAAPPAEEAKP